QMLRETGQPAGSRAPGPPQTPPTPPRGITAPAPPPRQSPALAPPLPFPSPARPAASHQPAARPAASGPAAVAALTGLDGLVAEMVQLSRPALAARPVRVEVRMTPGTPLPRCSPIGLKRSFAALFQGLSAVVTPQSAIVVRAEKKPVLFKGRDGSQQTRDFLMIAATHAGGLTDADQQRVLQGADAGPLGEAQRLVREMGGFIRFAPLPGGALETRIFLPA
ncbi:MAG TPA: hypothetical protein VMV01_21245, partial [Planctomycetota bacterium]|nr:hypothetical protein [Planctomycetota bacterium]